MQPALMNLKILLPFQDLRREDRRVAHRRGDASRARLDSCRTDSTAWQRSRREF